ncbi:P-loop containing nucleoside triphosphate hydrolase protein [Dipodascopsis uninucleata]
MCSALRFFLAQKFGILSARSLRCMIIGTHKSLSISSRWNSSKVFSRKLPDNDFRVRRSYDTVRLKSADKRLLPNEFDDVTYKQLRYFVRSRMDNLSLFKMRKRLGVDNIPQWLFLNKLELFSNAVFNLPEEQFYEENAPYLDEYLERDPILPHLGTLREWLMSPSNINKSLLEFDYYLGRFFVNYIHQTESRKKLQSSADDNLTANLTNMRYPEEWYPAARRMKRKWVLHVGPTNSGKTYNALKRLQESGSGVYAGPLRLLAREVYERFKAAGHPCNLITGEEVIEGLDQYGNKAALSASTVEMVDMDRDMEVAVIDEIQMIAEPDRGWAWTAALLGLRAKEIHCCGEERSVNLLVSMAKSLGEDAVVNYYERLSPLKVEKSSLDTDYGRLKKGDAVVTFSRENIFALRQNITKATDLKCAVIYGGLPPETRSRQAQLFNNPNSDVDILIASDAIGMGLNLSIKRVVFETTVKFDGRKFRRIDPNQVKQIAGRAGRYQAAVKYDNQKETADKVGYVTSLDSDDYYYLSRCLTGKPRQIAKAGIIPQDDILYKFALEFPADTSMEDILRQFYKSSSGSNLYDPCNLKNQLDVASMISDVKGLTLEEKLRLITAPVGSRIKIMKHVVFEFATAIAQGTPISLVDIPYFDLEAIEDARVDRPKTLQTLERLHKIITLYLWLSYRFPSILFDRGGAQELNSHVQNLIDRCLNSIQFRRKKTIVAEDLDEDVETSISEELDISEESANGRAVQSNTSS